MSATKEKTSDRPGMFCWRIFTFLPVFGPEGNVARTLFPLDTAWKRRPALIDRSAAKLTALGSITDCGSMIASTVEKRVTRKDAWTNISSTRQSILTQAGGI